MQPTTVDRRPTQHSTKYGVTVKSKKKDQFLLQRFRPFFESELTVELWTSVLLFQRDRAWTAGRNSLFNYKTISKQRGGEDLCGRGCFSPILFPFRCSLLPVCSQALARESGNTGDTHSATGQGQEVDAAGLPLFLPQASLFESLTSNYLSFFGTFIVCLP